MAEEGDMNPKKYGSQQKGLMKLMKGDYGQPTLEYLHPEIHQMIFKMVGTSGLKALRLTSTTLRQRVEEEEITVFKHWNLKGKFGSDPASDLNRFSEEVKTIKGLQIEVGDQALKERSDEFVQSMRALLDNHQEMESLHLHFRFCQDGGLLADVIRHTGHVISSLELIHCKFTLSDFNTGSLRCLKRLSFVDCGLSDEIFQSILSAVGENLMELELYDELRISGKGIAKSCRSLKKLVLHFCPDITEAELVEILTLSRDLNMLKLSSLDITGEAIANSSVTLEKLTSLELIGCGDMTDHGLVEILSVSPNLCSLELSKLKISGEEIAHSSISLKQLASLKLVWFKNLRDHGLTEMLSKMPNLQRLFMHNLIISGEGVANSCKSLDKLTSLELEFCPLLTDGGLSRLLSIMPCLQTLNLHCLKTSCEGISKFCESLPKLSTLSFKGVDRGRNVTESGLSELLSMSPNLQHLSIKRMSDISEKFITDLRNQGLDVEFD